MIQIIKLLLKQKDIERMQSKKQKKLNNKK